MQSFEYLAMKLFRVIDMCVHAAYS